MPTDHRYRVAGVKYEDCWDYPGYSQETARQGHRQMLTNEIQLYIHRHAAVVRYTGR